MTDRTDLAIYIRHQLPSNWPDIRARNHTWGGPVLGGPDKFYTGCMGNVRLSIRTREHRCNRRRLQYGHRWTFHRWRNVATQRRFAGFG
jgi:hypothetical protein